MRNRLVFGQTNLTGATGVAEIANPTGAEMNQHLHMEYIYLYIFILQSFYLSSQNALTIYLQVYI